MKDMILKEFEKVFDIKEAVNVFFAPGRVNLIGEHTDYNGGHVFPCALTFGTYAAVRKRDDSIIRMYSTNFKEMGIIEFDLHNVEYLKKHDWANYPKGVIYHFNEQGLNVNSGFDVLFLGNIPSGAGLSSSASIELTTAVLLKDLYGFNLDMIEMIKISKTAENKFIGVNCGIMDQFAIGMGKKDYAILLDTNTLKYEYVRTVTNGVSIVIANTNKRRRLADSKYNERRSQCEKALEDIKEKLSIKALGELNEEEFEVNKHLIKDQINTKRAKHAVYENRRTLKAAKALRENDINAFGKLMNESHISLRDDYEVTGVELDTLVELAWSQEGVIGSRMTGAGFGGCTVSIVRDDNIEEFIKNVGKAYADKIGYEASFYIAQIGDGARRL